MDFKELCEKLDKSPELLELEELIMYNQELLIENGIDIEGTVNITSVELKGLSVGTISTMYSGIVFEMDFNGTLIEIDLELIEGIEKGEIDESTLLETLKTYYENKVSEGYQADMGVIFNFGKTNFTGIPQPYDDSEEDKVFDTDDGALSSDYPGVDSGPETKVNVQNTDNPDTDSDSLDESLIENDLDELNDSNNQESDEQQESEDTQEENETDSENEGESEENESEEEKYVGDDVDNSEEIDIPKRDYKGESLEDTGIELYYNGKLYNTEENLEKVDRESALAEKQAKEKAKNMESEPEDVSKTQATSLSVIDYNTVLDHINREEIKKDYFRYYREISYTPGELKDDFVDHVTAWVYFKSIKENGKVDEDGVAMVEIPLGEDDKMEFVSTRDAEYYFEKISKEDSQNISDGVQEQNGNKYIYFKSEENKGVFDSQLLEWEKHFNQLKQNGNVKEYMESKGFRAKPKKPTEKPNSSEDELKLGTKEEVQENTEESNDDRKNKNGYFKMEVDEVITLLRKKDIAIRGVYRFVDSKYDAIKQQGVTDICLKEVMFEYEWGNIEGVNESEDVSQSIIFYYDFDLVTNNGIDKFRLPMRIRLDSLDDDGKPYITKDDFGDLIVKTDNLVSEIDKKGYHKFMYKGITVYVGKKGNKTYEDYVKESGIAKEPESNVPQSKVDADSESTNSKEDLIELIKRLHHEVEARVKPEQHYKANDMLISFLRKINEDDNRPAEVQFSSNYDGVCNIMEQGRLLQMDYAMGGTKGKKKGKGEVLIFHPFFIIAANEDGMSRVIYKKLTSPMSLIDLESMLVRGGYPSLRGVSKAMNLRNYSKHKAKNNPVSDVVKRGAKSGASRVIGNGIVKGTKYAGRALIGANKKKKR